MTEFDLWSNHNDCFDGNGNPKKRYFSESEARNMTEYLLETKGVSVRVYHCDDCGYWHVTKKLR